MSGGAVDAACRAVRERLFEHVAARARRRPAAPRRSTATDVVGRRSARCASPVADATAGGAFEETVEYHHRADRARSTSDGQGDCHTCRSRSPPTAPSSTSTPSSASCKVVQVATAQDVGRALNPLSVLGQIEGGIAQGVGPGGDGGDRRRRRPRSGTRQFTDYLLPTALDMPDVVVDASSRSPSPARRSGPRASASRRRISSTPAIVGRRSAPPPGSTLPRVPVRPQDIALAG